MNPNLKKWLSLGILSLAVAIVVIDGTVLNVSQKYLINDLSIDIKTIQWAFTAYSLVLAALTIFGGRLGDLFGRKKMFITGAIIFAIGSLMTALSQNAFSLILGWSVIEGIGAALMVPASSALLVSNFEGKERGTAFGIYGAIAGASASFGPILGGFFATNIGWRWAFGINVFIAIILCVGSLIVKDKKELYPKKTSLDYIGVVLSSLGLTGLVYGIIEKIYWLDGLAILLLVAFGLYENWYQKKGGEPLISLSMFKNRQFTFGVATLASLFGGFSGLITYGVVFFFLTVRGLDAFQAGLALIPFSLATFVLAPISPKIAHKIGDRNIVLLGLAFNTVGAFLIYRTLNFTATVNDFILPFLVTGIGFGMIAAQLNNIILSSVDQSKAGVASGINGTMREVARAIGVAVIGAAFLSTFTATAIANINSQPDSAIPTVLKTKIIAGLENGDSNLGKTDNQQAGPIGENITKQINLSVTEASKTAMLYTLGFNLLAVVMALGIRNKAVKK